ncbi:MAG: hypothetical protein ACRDGG_11195 [Anaerolineae bacterium]
MIRPSGTEPVLRVYAESSDPRWSSRCWVTAKPSHSQPSDNAKPCRIVNDQSPTAYVRLKHTVAML